MALTSIALSVSKLWVSLNRVPKSSLQAPLYVLLTPILRGGAKSMSGVQASSNSTQLTAQALPVPSGIFSYPLLPFGVDAIRILILEPGGFYDPLIGELVPATFDSRPKYAALSYTWSDSYLDNARLSSPSLATKFSHGGQHLASILPNGLATTFLGLPRGGEPAALTLNGHPFHLSHNLHLALLHLRSLTSPLTLWVDAICINQADLKERNAQVALMSFIFMRAIKMVAWLGTKDYRNHPDPFHSMSIDWKAGQAPHLAASLTGATKLRCSVEPDRNILARITESRYWKRIWIVQEICLPQVLVFVYGANVWAYEDFRQCNAFKAVETQPTHLNFAPQIIMNNRFKPMLELFAARDKISRESMRLESLVEQFATNGCSELRDRVYGLIGLADNIRPDTSTNYAANHIAEDIDSLHSRSCTLPEPEKGPRTFSVDYSRSFYELWTDVIMSVYCQTEDLKEQLTNQPIKSFPSFNDWESVSYTNERHRSVVRTAGIVQGALDQMVERDVINLNLYNASLTSCFGPQKCTTDKPEKTLDQQNKLIRAIGIVSAMIVHMGPDHRSLMASFQTHQDWVKSWDVHYNETSHIGMLRKKYQALTARTMNYEEKDMARIRNIQSPETVAWRIASTSAPKSPIFGCAADFEIVPDFDDICETVQSSGPRICLGTAGFIGLVPTAARPGDIVVQFWNCSAAIIMRSIGPRATDGLASSFMLVGRADVADAHEPKDMPQHDTSVAQRPLTGFDPMFENPDASRVVHIDLNLRTLQIITASISTF